MYTNMFRAALQWQTAALRMTQMTVSAGAVMQMRLMQMALGTMKPEEAVRMVLEKPATFLEAAERSSRALAANRGPAAATIAGLSPYRRATKRNEKRLRKR